MSNGSDMPADWQQILELAAAGLTSDRIAESLQQSETTIKRKRKEIMEHLGADNMPQAVAMAVRRGLIR
jgi:DNA-binding NarL/FixJ family response regulator